MKLLSHKVSVKKALGAAAAKGLTDATLDLLRRAAQDAPLDTGDLRGSGSATLNRSTTAEADKKGNVSAKSPPNVDGETTLEGVVGFTAPYALEQHENMALKHRDGKAKYLEDAYTQNIDRYEQHIEDAVREGMK